MSFTLEHLSAELFGKIVFLGHQRSSGLGGPGYIELLTSDGEEYFLGLQAFKYPDDVDRLVTILAKGMKIDITCRPLYFSKEVKGWKYIRDGYGVDLLIREDFYKQFIEAYENAKEKSNDVDGIEIAKKILDTEDKILRNVYV